MVISAVACLGCTSAGPRMLSNFSSCVDDGGPASHALALALALAPPSSVAAAAPTVAAVAVGGALGRSQRRCATSHRGLSWSERLPPSPLRSFWLRRRRRPANAARRRTLLLVALRGHRLHVCALAAAAAAATVAATDAAAAAAAAHCSALAASGVAFAAVAVNGRGGSCCGRGGRCATVVGCRAPRRYAPLSAALSAMRRRHSAHQEQRPGRGDARPVTRKDRTPTAVGRARRRARTSDAARRPASSHADAACHGCASQQDSGRRAPFAAHEGVSCSIREPRRRPCATQRCGGVTAWLLRSPHQLTRARASAGPASPSPPRVRGTVGLPPSHAGTLWPPPPRARARLVLASATASESGRARAAERGAILPPPPPRAPTRVATAATATAAAAAARARTG
eukprot:scaffold156_cov308-Prasinococcus_capsulatus_cf.AAC.14